MTQHNLFEDNEEIIIKQFKPRDVFYNNGIVNLYQFLKNKDFELDIELSQNELTLELNALNKNKIYTHILNSFLKDNQIVYQTDNDRWYFDENKMDFIKDKKFDTKGGQKNDLRNGVYLYKKISELGIARDEAENLYIKFCERDGLKPEKEPNGNLKVPNKNNELVIAITLDQAIQRFSEYFVSSDILSIDSKIHSFEDGQNCFHDMLKQSKGYKIDKWDALIYWFGGRTKRFFNYSYFIYPNSSNLEALNKFKEFLKISDDKIPVRNEKDKITITTSNIDFFNILNKDEIFNKNFYISKSAEEFEVKFFMYLFSVMYHIEERHENANERRNKRYKEVFDTLQYMSFTIYTDDGTFKTSLNEYTKAYKLIQFFQNLKEQNLFKYLSDLITIISLSQGNNEVNLNIVHWCQKLLNFADLRKEYYLVSFNMLKNGTRGFGKTLFEFEQNYLNSILRGKDMSIHENAKKIGDGIGYFCAAVKDRDLLFKLRNVKNYKQLVAYFKDLKFSILKNEEDAKFSKEFNTSLEAILDNIEQDWEVARDYIAIYAIDKFRATNYQSSKSKQGE